ncbi:ribosome silencing factor [Sediminicurvatus halobius]|uniref:Ribosomal silencing factor RsfS n=1 Tax=Sediminicurvatus halobius TaxID=2182432 RepID=A0A2U2N840_9GAMM|nr:ribosome silencing factor [Spiribacter halobius]PWG64102.1 ribosome silencing factor [Spiribacter halobius]PWG65263.1 ribosome silencing factor [Spiribacter halobius]UEX78781.1 ribosome silencing factor [Spiribacter halobius]
MKAIADTPEAARDLVRDALEEMKAEHPVILDVRGRTAITDFMAFATGNSRRHVKSISERLVERAKAAGCPPLGVEGLEGGEWVLVDLGDAVAHVMLEEVRDFYRLERIWGVDDDLDALGEDDAAGQGGG